MFLTLLMSLIVNQWLSPGYKLTVFEVFAKHLAIYFMKYVKRMSFQKGSIVAVWFE